MLFAAAFPRASVYVGVVVVLLLALWFVGTARLLGRLRRHWQEAWAKVETELRRRQELAGRLTELFRQIGAAGPLVERASAVLAEAGQPGARLADRSRHETALGQALRSLLSSAEAAGLPGQALRDFQQQLSEASQRIHATRRFYNANARQYNLRVEVFPSSLVAGVCGFRPAHVFDLEEVDLQPAEAAGVE